MATHNTKEVIEEFFTEQDEHGYSVDTAASGGDLNNKEYVRDYLTPKLHKLLHQELQQAREEERERIKRYIQKRRKEVNIFCAGTGDIFVEEIMKEIDHSELEQTNK